MAGKKILLLLDDAAGHEQVRPLLPGTAGSLVLVTSRRRLTALEDAAVISLDTLPPARRRRCWPGWRPGPDCAPAMPRWARSPGLCGYLPLAIGMLASQLRHHPAWTAGEPGRRPGGGPGPAGPDARGEPVGRRRVRPVLRRPHPGPAAAVPPRSAWSRVPSIDAYAAAALDGTSLAAARRSLDELYDQHLLAEPAPGRYQLHDLLREHARALAAADDPAESDAAAGRLLDYYLHTALAAGRHFDPWASAYRRPPPGRPPAQAPDVSTLGQAAAWLEAERANLHAAADYAAGRARSRHAIAIPAAMSGFLAARGHWDQSAALHQSALAAARQAGDRLGEADTLAELGVLQARDRGLPGRRRQPGPGSWRSTVTPVTCPARPTPSTSWASVHVLTGDYPAAAASHQQALALARSAGDRLAEAEPSSTWAWCSS